MNRNILLDVLSNELSSPEQKAQAQAGLDRLDHTKVVPVDLTAQPTATEQPPEVKSNVSIDRIGLICSGIGYTDPAEGYPAADAAARLRCPEFDGPKYREQQRQQSHDECLCTAANQADSDNRMAIIKAEHPMWERSRVMDAYAAQDESHTKFVLIEGTVEKRKYDAKWEKYDLVPIAVAPSAVPVAVPVVVAVPVPIPMRELSEENKLLVAEARRDLEMRQIEIKAQAMREARAQMKASWAR